MMRPQTIVRPTLWGFFICVIAAVLLGLGEYVSIYWTKHSWNEKQRTIERERGAKVQSAFQQRVEELFRIAYAVASDTGLIGRLASNSPADLVTGIDQLETYRRRGDVSIDLVDPRGTVVAWVGRSTEFDYKHKLESELSDSFVVVSQADLHTNLSVGVRIPSNQLLVVVSGPLEVNFPISNRFVSSVSFADELSTELGVDVRLVPAQNAERPLDQYQYVALRDLKGASLLSVAIAAPSLNAEIQSIESSFGGLESLAVSIGTLFLALVIWEKLRIAKSPWIKVAGTSLLIWAVRYTWHVMQFPSAIVGGTLFDPSAYGSPFSYGITSSAGETLLSCSALFLNALLLLQFSLSLESNLLGGGKRDSFGARLASLASLFVCALLVPLMVRGYGAAVRSFVFDSTLRYQDPTVLLPEFVLLAMHLNIFLLSVSLLCFFLGFLGIMNGSLSRLASSSSPATGKWIVLALTLLVVMILFAVVEGRPQVSYPVEGFIVLVGLGTSIWFHSRRPPSMRETSPLAVTFSVFVCVAFLVSAPVLDAKLHDKERQQVQTFAEELLRPVDTWLSFVVSDGLRSVQSEYLRMAEEGNAEFVGNTNTAFALWARTLMGREGYNSAVVVYNTSGQEVSRFSVGLSSYEQGELLSRVFDVDEETLQLLERRVGGGTIKYYGVWGTVRKDNGEVMAIVGLMLSASQRTLFRGEVPEPLRTISREQFESPFRQFYITEYEDGYSTSTTDDRFFRRRPLDQDVRQALRSTDRRFVWKTEEIQDKNFEVLYAGDNANPERILSISAEPLDLRWHLFNFTKMFMVYAFVLALVLFALFVASAYLQSSVRLGFREKLLVAFILLTVIPLVLSGWYNRQLSLERLEENTTKELSQDLDLIQHRIASTLSDENDFEAGVTDDYCEVVASDLGVDFSIYRRSILQASSRPELYKAAILDKRLPGRAFMHVVVLGQGFYRDTEKVGEVEYVVGYRPIILHGNLLGVLAVPALYRQKEIDEELAERNAFILGVYAIVFGLVIAIGVALANRFSKPLRDLSQAAQMIGRGNLDVHVVSSSGDETGELVRSFNEMAGELKQSRESLAKAERELAWKEMAKQVAHEIKNPLTPMKLSIQHLRKAYEDRARDFETILQNVSRTIMEQIDSLSRIASEFSNFARMPTTKFSRVNVNDVLRETIDLFGEVSGIEFRANFWHTSPILVADKDELRRVFINIIRNSVQAMEKGGAISVATEVKDQLCIIWITDSGPGIPEEIRMKVFQPNFSTKTDGMGLGLAIARKSVQDINGSIELHSQLGKGTTVEIKIPFVPGVDG